ncbi:hypothetical protein O0I10_000982 [Lichtheimia ornata]|uniref:Uncharacterized protein n=1 Tax=Lichtheimia ornata TaxID=688661 RepID=A0AAD8DHJ7_9FUNG|nr:uncharacterized protein O0I10_000982 [Lichtheimia ornata]KAJ8662806.1 hypothetical protein O0I10_000982 [Lichtheimia ornata]
MNEYGKVNGAGHSMSLFESDNDMDLRIMQLHKAIREQHILLEALDDDGQHHHHHHHHDVSDLKSRIRSLSEQLHGSTTGATQTLITRYELNKKRLEDLQSEGHALEKELEYMVNTGIQSTLDALTLENNRLHELTQLNYDDGRIMEDINSLRHDAHHIVRHELSSLSSSSPSSSKEDRQKQQERQMFEKGLFVSAPLARFIESLDKPTSSSSPSSSSSSSPRYNNTVYKQQPLPPSPPISNSSNSINSQRSTVDIKAEAQRRIEQRRLLFASKNSKSTSNLRARREHVTCAPEKAISEDEKAAQERLRKAEADARERLQTMRERRNKARLESDKEALRQQQQAQEKRMAEERQRQHEMEEEEKTRVAKEQQRQREIEEEERVAKEQQRQREIEEEQKRVAEEQRQREIEEEEKRVAEERQRQREIEEEDERAAEEQRQRRARFAAEQAAKEKRLRQEEFERKAREIEAAQIEAQQRQQQWLAEHHKQEHTPSADDQQQEPIPTSNDQQDNTITTIVEDVDLSDEVDFGTIYRVKTLYEYRGTREDDLCFKEDEVIKAYPHKDSHSDWWYGTSLLTNQSGFFPRTYVEVVDQAFRVRTLYDFQKTREDDLGFTENEIIVVQPFQDEDSDWWYGTNEDTHQAGYFPKTYVEVIPSVPSTDTPSIHSNHPTSDPVTIMLQAPPEDDSSRNMSAPNTPVMKKETLSANRSETARRRRATSNVGLAGSLSSAPIDHRQTSSSSPSSSTISSMSATPGLVTWASTMDPSELAVISPEERKRQEAIFELVSTEKSYLRDLQLIANVFYTESMKYLARDEQDVVFSNIDDLLLTNTALLSDMEARQNEGANVADNLKCYSTYCRNQSFASRLLQDKRKQDQWFNVFLKTAQSRPECRGLDLSHFLLEPMQRITRYPLLLQNILNATPRRHSDYGLLRSALIKTESILQHVNEETRRYENIQKMDELSRILDMGGHAKLKVHGREFVMEGVLYKAKSGRKLHGYLFNDTLILTEPLRELSPEGYLHRLYKEPLNLDRINIRQLPQQMSIKAPFSGSTTVSSEDAGFQLVYGNQVISVKAPSMSQKRQWISQIQHFSALRSTIQRQSWSYN